MKLIGKLFAFIVLVSFSACDRYHKVSPEAGESVPIVTPIPEGVFKFKFFEDKKESKYTITFGIVKVANGGFIIEGKSAINNYYAPVEISSLNKTIKIGILSTTKMAGGADETKFETDFLTRLLKVNSFKIEENKIVLLCENKSELHFQIDCIEKVEKEAICTQEHEPVCGCNNKTYTNECTAEASGILNFTKGKCK